MELLKNLEGLSADEQMSAVVELQKAAMKHLEEQKQASIGKSAEMVILGLKKIKSDFEAKFDSLNYDIQTKVANLKDGEQGLQGPKGEQGDRGLDGYQGKDGRDGKDGKDGTDGQDGVGVTDAKIDFDGSLVITLSDGREINVGEVVPVDVAEKIRTVHNIQSGSGGDSQTVLDAIAALQATIATYGTMATQNANNVAITGGTINNTTVGATTPSTGVFTTLTAQNETLKGTGQNFLLWSADFSNGVWAGLISNVTRTVSTLDFTNSSAYCYQLVNPSPIGTQLTFSVTLSSSNKTAIAIRIIGTATSAGALQLVTLTSTPTRYTVTATVPSGNTAAWVGFENRVASGGDGSVGLITVSNAQLEIGSTANTYIPTTTTAVYGTPTLSFSGVASIGLQSDGSLYETSAGTGNVRFYTNNIGQEQARVSHTASAVNYVQLTGAATGGAPAITSQGSDANIGLSFSTKGAFNTSFRSGNGSWVQFVVNGANNSVNYLSAAGSVSNQAPVLSSVGSDTNISQVFQSKGTGNIQFQTNAGAQEQLRVAHTASAVNYVQVTGNVTGSRPTISSQGSDSNIGMNFLTKGNRAFTFLTNNVTAFEMLSPASSVNYFQVNGSISGSPVVLQTLGTDTNIDLTLTPKGTGNVRFGTYTGTILTPTGYVEIKDSGGTVRRLLVG